MLLTIDAPDVESRLQQEAARRGMTTADYARQLLESSLTPQDSDSFQEENTALIPADSWSQAFDAWIDGHPQRTALPENAFERASFYRDSFYPEKESA